MKKILFIFLFLGISMTMSAQNYYETQWKKIENNYKKGLFKSNLPIILEIQNRALKDKNSVQLIRSLKAEFSIVNQTEDDPQNDSASGFFSKLQTIEKELKNDEKVLYKVLLGEFFDEYYNSNSWQINQRTNLNNQDFSQIESWSKQDFKNFLSTNYAELKQEKAVLKQIKMQQYKEIFQNTENLEYFPTLFDWSSSQQIQFLRNQQLFTPNELHANHDKINTLFDELIAHHPGNSQLYFQHQKINYTCEFTNCKNRLEQLQNLFRSSAEGDYKVMIADDIAEELLQKNQHNEALLLIGTVKKTYPKSKFLNNIINRENAIVNPLLLFHYEKETQSQKPIHIVAEHKNVDRFSLNIYQTDDVQGFMNYVYDSYRHDFESVKKTLVRKEIFEIHNKKDYRSYKTSYEIQPLPSGIYLVEFVVEDKIQDSFYFIASENRVIDFQKNDFNKNDDIKKLMKRENGAEIPNTNIDFYEHVQGKPLTKASGKSDSQGKFVFPQSANKNYYRYYLLKSAGNNYQLVNHYDNRNKLANDIKDRATAQIFLDRAIYRPGQTVYFKAIATAFNGKGTKENVAEKVQLNVILKDANGEEISKQTLTTNDFGSVHGSFALPKGKLNGSFRIEVKGTVATVNISSHKYFSVEEYKRPKFEVTFEPIKDEYKYGETIELKGKAMMFSGVPLSNASVNYEIKKRNIRWRYFGWFPQGEDNENSILGSVQTDEKGEFAIRIELKKDETLEGIQIDNYEIEASVTDINGETQSATENVKVASVSHYIQAENLGNIFTDEHAKLKVETKNYNDQNLYRPYHVKLSKLQEPDRIFRDNFKSTIQDLPQLSKAEFIQKFPHDRFDKNDDIANWKVEKIIVNRLENSSSSSRNEKQEVGVVEKLDLGILDAGTYQLELFNIEGKDTIKSVQHFQVWDKRFLKNSQKPFLEIIAPKEEVQRGTKARVYVYSAVPDAGVTVFLQTGNGETKTEQHRLKNGVLVYEIPVPNDESINNLNLEFQMVALNDVQTKSVDLKIKNEKKDLRIETVTFRDKLQPNSKEKWTVKILGNDNEKINAEVLANMYDMSLDQFAKNQYSWQTLWNRPYRFVGYNVRTALAQEYFSKRIPYLTYNNVNVPEFNWFDGGIYKDLVAYGSQRRETLTGSVGKVANVNVQQGVPGANTVRFRGIGSLSTVYSDVEEVDADGIIDYGEIESLEKIQVRQNLNETAFFYPNLLTDKDGNVTFEFTSPEALTKWKMMFLAHTKDARAATLEKEVITQKEFSVTPNYPRFLREGDELNLQSKLSSLINEKLSGTAQLQILDAFTNEDISEKFGLIRNNSREFKLEESGNSVLSWKLKVPNDVSSIILKIVAKAGNYSDGEQKAIAVLPNRMLVTDAVPVFVKEGQTKTFILENLAKNTSKTATNVANTLELTTNPIWEIMFALPTLKNDANNSADVVFNKWFADVLASEIFKANPKLKTVFEEYQNKGLLTSNLEKNQELKQLLLEETPWVLESENETEQMEKLARLFDANTMRNSIQNDWAELKKLQNPDGGFSWHPGYPSSYYTSLYILKNLGRINDWLKGNVTEYQSADQKELISKLISYVDNEVNKYWDVKRENVWNNFVLDYLDTRHYWENQYPLKNKGATLKNLVIQKAPKAEIKDFTFFGLHRAAKLFHEYKLTNLSNKLLTYLKETSTQTETQGVYWKQNLNNWGWYSSKTVNHAGALETFQKLRPNDPIFIEEMKIWLITQKEVNSWGTSRGTAEVIFTILNSGKSWTTAESDKATVVWGGKLLTNADTQATGYVKKSIKENKIDPSLATVTVTKPGPGIVQGGLFWQYYEDLDKIKSSESYISITKELYKKVKTENGEELIKITEHSPLKVGDKVTVRMVLNTDRNMEFIHLKDMRAAGFEPLNVISGYRWNNGLGYYQSSKDASTNFYIEYMPKGKYVFEYDYICNASGTFSNGITTLQNYYAPQMNAHTMGSRVTISE